jgi:hypothetical protein
MGHTRQRVRPRSGGCALSRRPDTSASYERIECMPRDYVENVIRFCRRRAVWIYVLAFADRDDEELLDEEGDEPPDGGTTASATR